ncbi:MAG: sel1 repeat family protein [Alphaproteobacteria bacterium]|nr:sel1 repeat family protein [Alphaproteobacteria bacterium]MBT4018050.1 sel1 repeat family protein [Alphaproteobacteria bacterium]MBT5160591.1 sel1 repeat family protein [Alphaproteobacteria bacterium]
MRLKNLPLAFGLSLAALLPLSMPVQSETITECDRLATDPMDRARVADGVSYQTLMSDEAMAACNKATILNEDNPRLAYQFGRLLLLHKNKKQGLKQVIRAAENGYLAAQLLLTSGYSSGNFFKGDAKQAYYWAEKAATQGSKYAQASAATWLVEGTGTEKKIDQGLARLEDYSKAGNAYASFSLAVIYRQGNFVKTDVARAIGYYETAGKAGLGAAYGALAMMYLGGESVKKDIDRAYQVFLEGAEAGHVGVQLLFARSLAEGLVPSEDGTKEAVVWMCTAGERGKTLHFELFRRDISCPVK